MAFHATHGPVLFGGRLGSEMDAGFALPDSMGSHLNVDVAQVAVGPPAVGL